MAHDGSLIQARRRIPEDVNAGRPNKVDMSNPTLTGS